MGIFQQAGGGDFVSLKIKSVGVADFVVEQSSNYVRYNSGLQICWGHVAALGAGTNTVNLPCAFVNTDYCVMFGHQASATTSTNWAANGTWNRTTTSFSTRTGDHIKDYIAMGKWK